MMIIRTEVNFKFFILCLLTSTDFIFKGCLKVEEWKWSVRYH